MPRSRHALMSAIAALALLIAGLVAADPSPLGATTTPAPSTQTAAYDAQQVLSLINQQRSANHVRGLRMNTSLTKAAHAHNCFMARYNTLSHKFQYEHSLGYRVTYYGYSWSATAENIGVTTDWSLNGILSVEKRMYAEVAPNDGHRRILLSSTYVDVGIDVLMDATHHKAWITMDFGRPA